MFPTIKRSGVRGFTLIELLIVVIILAILAAIAIPQFSASTSDAQAAAVDSNLANVRSAIEQYKAQHGNVYPGSNTSSGATCAVGAKLEGDAGTFEAMDAQLKGYSNATGQVCSAPNDTYKYGPYLRQGIPNEPINNKSSVVVTKTGAPIVATALGGWAYDTKSGQFIMNSTANDNGSPARAYSLH
jgi:general secretion pathway protein G